MNETHQEIFGYRFHDSALLDLALTHPSARYERNLPDDNQRMEYLGDAVLGLASAKYLYYNFRDLPEGQLTMLRSNLTSTATLAEMARINGLGTLLALGRGEEQSGGRNKSNNLADALEAVIGAIYLDGTMTAVEEVFLRLFVPLLDTTATSASSANYKGILQEWAQKAGLPCPIYTVVEETGPAHQRMFAIEVQLTDGRKTTGHGSSKRFAEQEAAMKLLSQITAN